MEQDSWWRCNIYAVYWSWWQSCFERNSRQMTRSQRAVSEIQMMFLTANRRMFQPCNLPVARPVLSCSVHCHSWDSLCVQWQFAKGDKWYVQSNHSNSTLCAELSSCHAEQNQQLFCCWTVSKYSKCFRCAYTCTLSLLTSLLMWMMMMMTYCMYTPALNTRLWLALLQLHLLSTMFNVTTFWKSLWGDIKRFWLYCTSKASWSNN